MSIPKGHFTRTIPTIENLLAAFEKMTAQLGELTETIASQKQELRYLRAEVRKLSAQQAQALPTPIPPGLSAAVMGKRSVSVEGITRSRHHG